MGWHPENAAVVEEAGAATAEVEAEAEAAATAAARRSPAAVRMLVGPTLQTAGKRSSTAAKMSRKGYSIVAATQEHFVAAMPVAPMDCWVASLAIDSTAA